MNTPNTTYEVVIIGGSYAGLSAALTLGRSLRRVLIIDSGRPCNRYTPHSHNFITQDGVAPAIISANAKEQVLKYETVSWQEGHAISATSIEGGYEVATADGGRYTTQRLVMATGVRDLLPEIGGFAECWGRTIIHCPYCHGYEVRGVATALLADGERAMHMAPLIKNLTDQLSLITSGPSSLSAEDIAKLKRNNITIHQQPIAAISQDDGQLRSITLDDGRSLSVSAMYAALPHEQHSDIPVDLGCEMTDSGHIQVDMYQRTTVEGVYACGDNSSPLRSVANAAYTGSFAGAVANHELSAAAF